MSRLPTPFVGLVLAVLVLVFGSVATAKESPHAAIADPSPSALASSHQMTGNQTPRRPTSPASPKLRSNRSKPAKAQLTQRSQFRPSDNPQKSQSTKHPAGKHGDTVYLTFDDGPSQYTAAILNILRASHSTATFFELGFRQAKYPAAAARVRAEGSSIGNHTYDHPDLTALTSVQVRWQLTHGPRGRCMRPPFGATNPGVQRIVAQQGLREVLWTIDTMDWSRPGTAKIIKAATGPSVRGGSIVLLHDGGGDRSETLAALPKIINTLQQRGYVIRSIPGC
jgi:peptidoglycan/xylan/chitin deacetylase (PgdA/CDA1 family)